MTPTSNDTIDWSKVPVPRMADGIRRYVEHGIPPSHFLTALLKNDLQEAVGRADDENVAALKQWVMFLRWELPPGCHGSPEKVRAWIAHKGLDGNSAEACISTHSQTIASLPGSHWRQDTLIDGPALHSTEEKEP